MPNDNSFDNFKIKAGLLVLILAAIIPIVAASFLFSRYLANEIKKQKLFELSTVAKIATKEQEQIVEASRQLLIAISASPEINNLNQANCNRFLSGLIVRYQRYSNFALITPAGQTLCAAKPETSTDSTPRQTLIDRTINSNGITLGRYRIEPNTGKPILNLAYPVTNTKHHVWAIVYATLDLNWVNDLIESSKQYQYSTTIILDRDGVILASSPENLEEVETKDSLTKLKEKVLKEGQGTLESRGVNGQKMLYSFTTLDTDKSAYIITGIPQKFIYQDSNKVIIIGLSTIFIATFFSFFLAWKIGDAIIIKQINSLRQIDKLKNDFVSLASHQIRSPMTAVRWISESILETKSLKKESRLKIKQIHETTLRLIHLTSTLLNISRLESDTITPRSQKILLNEVLEPLLNEFVPLIKKSRLFLKIRIPKHSLSTDPLLLGEVLRVLISNAIKYSVTQGTIEINVSKANTKIKFQVKNRGIDIPQKSKDKIFTRFYRADNAKTLRPEGNGLGLYLAKLITKKLHGTLSFISKGQQTTFVLVIPDTLS